jgi:hemoglobin
MRTFALCALLLSACAGPKQETQAASSKKSLYDRLGGEAAITAVVDSFVGRCAKDQRIAARFANADVPHLKKMLVEQICQASGGPCKYTGKDMKTAHKGMNLGDDEFDALVGDLKGALDEFKVPAQEQNDLLGALGPMKPDIVHQ